MKKHILAFLCLFAAACGAQELLRIVNGTEERTVVPPGLPPAVTNAYARQLAAAGYLPVVTVGAPHEDWCTRAVRTLTQTNGFWREEWIECPVPVPLDRVKLCDAILALPDGTNTLALAMSFQEVAEWFVGDPVYVRGSVLAASMQALLHAPDVRALEAFVRPCAAATEEK